MRYTGRLLYLVFLVLALVACSESAELFASLDEPEPEIVLSTVDSGAVLAPETAFSVEISYREDEFQPLTALLIDLYDHNAALVWEIDLEDDLISTSSVQTIDLPELVEAPYRLVLTGMRGQEIVFTEERTVFVLSDAPRIDAIGVYPSRPAAETIAVAVATLDAGPISRPYLRWWFAGNPVAEGYAEDDYDTIDIALPAQAGVYSLEVELFPWGPDEGVDLSATAIDVQAVEVFVGTSDQAPLDDTEILVYPFDGTTAAIGDYALDRNAEIDGPVEMAVQYGALGLLINAGSEIRLPISVVPAGTGAVVADLSLLSEGAIGQASLSIDSASLQIDAVFFASESQLSVDVTSSGGSAGGVLQLRNEYPLRDVSLTVDRSETTFLVVLTDGTNDDSLELQVPAPPSVPGGPIDPLQIVEAGSIAISGAESMFGVLDRVSIRSGSVETDRRLAIIRDLQARDIADQWRFRDLLVHIGNDPTVQTLHIPGRFALALSPNTGRIAFGDSENDATISRQDGMYTIDLPDDPIDLTDADTLIFDLERSDESIVLQAIDSDPIAIMPGTDSVAVFLTNSALAILDPRDY